MDNNKEMISKIDELILSNEVYIEQEGILSSQGNPVTKREIMNLFKMEKAMCKIFYEKIENYEIKKGHGTGFFCAINNFPIKYALFTNNHILNEDNIIIGKKINIEYFDNSKYIEKGIEINDERRVFTNKEMDYTIIELKEYDGIKDYFEIDPILFHNNKNYIKNSDTVNDASIPPPRTGEN